MDRFFVPEPIVTRRKRSQKRKNMKFVLSMSSLVSSTAAIDVAWDGVGSASPSSGVGVGGRMKVLAISLRIS